MIDLHIKVDKGQQFQRLQDNKLYVVNVVLSTEVLIYEISSNTQLKDCRWVRKKDLKEFYIPVDLE